jgi:hypothetical protein
MAVQVKMNGGSVLIGDPGDTGSCCLGLHSLPFQQ